MMLRTPLKKPLAISVSLIFIVFSQGLSAQTGQALSAEELKQINQQPIIPSIQNRGETGKSGPKQPSFSHQEADGTKINEYRESGKSTEVIVQTGAGTRYEMSNPQDSANPKIRNQDVNRVPSVKLPF